MSFAAQAPPCNVYAMSQSDTAKQYTYRRRQPEETVLYKTVAAHVETFIADRETEGHPVPQRVAKELRNYLTCGILQYGFLRVLCPSGDYETVVPYNCMGRGFCPSCCGKRGAEDVGHLVDQVLPWAPSRRQFSGRFVQRIALNLHATLAQEAAQHGKSLNKMAVEFIQRGFKAPDSGVFLRQSPVRNPHSCASIKAKANSQSPRSTRPNILRE